MKAKQGRASISVAMLLLSCLTSSMVGCATSGGSLTIFPTGNFLTRRAKEVALDSQTPAQVPSELSKSVMTDYFIQPGDVLLVESTDFESFIRFPSDQEVLPDGTIDLGKYGRIVVAGMTLEQIEELAEQQIEQLEGEDIEPINVRLVGAESAVYYVLGEVNAPGSYPLIGRETILDAILMAGGITDRASSCDIVLARPTYPNGCRVVLPVCYDNLTQLGDTSTNYQIRPGDRIYVGTRRLKEELMFWKEECEHCGCPGQCACPDPEMTPTGPAFPINIQNMLPTTPTVAEPSQANSTPIDGSGLPVSNAQTSRRF